MKQPFSFLTLILPMALVFLLAAGASGNASATAYAYSYSNIFGLTVSNPTGSIAVAGNTDISRSTATLNGSSVIRGGNGFVDAPQSGLGAVTKGQNDFSQQGQGGASYSRGDAQIISSQIPPFPAGATSTHAVNAAEAFLFDTGNADASGRNGSNTGLRVNLVVGAPGATILFNFQAAPFMQVYLDALAGAGSSSSANMSVSFTITNAQGLTVFNWSPDGAVGSGISGGTEFADAADLNLSHSSNTLTSGNLLTYDPLACGAPAGTGTGSNCGGAYTALSNNLVAGNYTLTLNTVNSADLSIFPTVQLVSEPGTLALFAMGLAGLCLARRKATASLSGGVQVPRPTLRQGPLPCLWSARRRPK